MNSRFLEVSSVESVDKRGSYYSFDLTEWLGQHGFIPIEEWSTWWFAERNPPHDDGMYTFSNECISASTHPNMNTLGDYGNCAEVAGIGLCYGWDPMDYIHFAQSNEYGDLVTTINCKECGCIDSPIHVTDGAQKRDDFDYGDIQRSSHPQTLAYRRFREFVNPYRRF